MKISSPSLIESKYIPQKYTCDGEGVNPPLKIEDVPETSSGLVLIMDDPDAPGGVFTHWLIWNIDPETQEIKEDSVPAGSVEGKNSGGDLGYYPPCPPSGIHRYFFRLYALSTEINLPSGSNRAELERAMSGYVIGEARFMKEYPA